MPTTDPVQVALGVDAIPFDQYAPTPDEIREQRHARRRSHTADPAPWIQGNRDSAGVALGRIADTDRRTRIIRPTKRTGGKGGRR